MGAVHELKNSINQTSDNKYLNSVDIAFGLKFDIICNGRDYAKQVKHFGVRTSGVSVLVERNHPGIFFVVGIEKRYVPFTFQAFGSVGSRDESER